MEQMNETEKRNFWNNWQFKDIITIAVLIITAIVTFTQLQGQVELNRQLSEQRIYYIETKVKEVNDRLKEITEEIKILNRMNK